MIRIECPYCNQDSLMFIRAPDKISLATDWDAYLILGNVCACEGAARMHKVYILPVEDGEPDAMYIENESEVDGVFAYLMGI